MILSLLGLGMVLGGMSAPCMQEVEHEQVVFHEENRKLATYDDEAYTITLSADELNNYTWTNFNGVLYESLNVAEPSFDGTYPLWEYDSDTLDTDDSDVNTLDNYAYFTLYTGQVYQIKFNTDVFDNKFHIIFWSADNQRFDDERDFAESLLFEVDSDLYDDVKTAIEQDIVDNTNSMPSIADIFQQVTSAITSFVGSLGQAFTSITALFYDSANSQWTFLGVLILIGVGVGLVYGVYRIIKGLLHRV